MKQLFFLFAFISLGITGCTVSFIGTTIDYEKIKTFSVEQFGNAAANAPATIGQQFSEQLKAKILNNTRLQYKLEEGDIAFVGEVREYKLSSLAPQANQTTALQRLTIGVYAESRCEKDLNNPQVNWSQSFSRFADFASDANLVDVQDQLINDIYTQMMDDVFNKAFTGW
jgi:prophage DNA circulation protein